MPSSRFWRQREYGTYIHFYTSQRGQFRANILIHSSCMCLWKVFLKTKTTEKTDDDVTSWTTTSKIFWDSPRRLLAIRSASYSRLHHIYSFSFSILSSSVCLSVNSLTMPIIKSRNMKSQPPRYICCFTSSLQLNGQRLGRTIPIVTQRTDLGISFPLPFPSSSLTLSWVGRDGFVIEFVLSLNWKVSLSLSFSLNTVLVDLSVTWTEFHPSTKCPFNFSKKNKSTNSSSHPKPLDRWNHNHSSRSPD